MQQLLFLFLLAISLSAKAAIYGPDNRKDISKTEARWKVAAQAVAVVLPSLYLMDLDEENYVHEEFDQRPYAESVGLCKDEKFADQKTFGHCTAFLVQPNIVVSAGHCFLPTGAVENQAHSYCENFSFWFGYNDLNVSIPELGARIPKKDVARCKKVIYATNNEKSEPEDRPVDFAIYELEEPLTHISPLKVSLKELAAGQTVATIGHPHGLPAKYSGLSPVLKNYETTLSAFMDTLSGNSGGPVFNIQAEVVGILISGHQHDTFEDKKAGCDRLNTCNNLGQNCDMNTKMENSNLIMKSPLWYQKIEDFMKESSPPPLS